MTRLRRIGVLGGMGPEATVALLQRIQAGILASDDADHVPLLVDLNPQVPSRIQHLIEKTGPNPGPVIAEMAVRLETAGAEALILPCNTAHHYARYVTDRVTIPFLSMPQKTCDALAGIVSAGSHIGILASPATNLTGLFQKLLADQGLRTLWPKDEDIILTTIQRIKSAGLIPDNLAVLQDKTTELVDQGAAAILIGCTEFSLVSAYLIAPVPIVDALDVLVDATLEFSGANRFEVGHSLTV
ncbi:MAG: amino acid racemase [Paracoccaceae bacterium]|nr:amino acid racemase [Paracoccaceae bacterium]